MAQSAMSYHVRLAQEILTMTASEPGLHNEVYCQLIRLTNGHPYVHMLLCCQSDVCACGTHFRGRWVGGQRRYPHNAVFMQCWHLLVLMIPLCLPTSFFLRYVMRSWPAQ